MTAPEKCPHCGAERDDHGKLNGFACESFYGYTGHLVRLSPCYEAEIAKLKACVVELERMIRCYNFWGRQSLPEEKP